MTGLQRLCRAYGRLQIVDSEGQSVSWAWDYANEKAVREEDMPIRSEAHAASEKTRWTGVEKDMKKGGGEPF